MTVNQNISQFGLVRSCLTQGGSIHPLILDSTITNGTGIMNPSVYVDGGQLLCNIRHVNYTLYHSENKRFQHRYGPLQYLHPENDQHLRTWNYLAYLDHDLSITKIDLVDTAQFDQDPVWEFVGLEDARLFRWDDTLYLSGVRRDTTTTGEGRMELSTLSRDQDSVRESRRERIPSTGDNTSYCEKNWMPVLDQPYHYVKWTNPTEVVKYDPKSGQTQTVFLDQSPGTRGLPDLRGGSQVIPYGDYYLAITHEVCLFKSEHGQKDATYRHRFVVWTRDWKLIRVTDSFSFMGADIEFCCGAAWHNQDLLISFGYQDNAAFILKMPRSLLDQLLWGKNQSHLGLDWGDIKGNSWFLNQVEDEVFEHDVYQMIFSVDANDIVVDVGASVGPFLWKIADRDPGHVYCVEPEPSLFRTLADNAQKLSVPCTLINRALAPATGEYRVTGLFDPTTSDISNGSDANLMPTISFQSLIAQFKLDHIDFLKIACEGAEYDIFNDDNFDWIIKNVRKIAGKFHLNTPELKAKFRRFRDTYLRQMTSHQVQSLDYVDINPNLWSDWFINYYDTVNIWIDNRVPLQQKKKWQHHPAPTLEVTTTVPQKGCVVDCVFCPQRVLTSSYQGQRIMKLEDFQRWIDKVPQEVRITFSGFVEPWMNKHCTDMVLYAYQQGHPISVFTTGIGMSVADIKAMAHIPFAGNPNGGFTLHLPDSELLARHPITPGYVELCEWIRDNRQHIQNFQVMSMGADIHPAVNHCFPDHIMASQMWDRSGNLSREALLKPDLQPLTNRWHQVRHNDGPRTCGCIENLYHNVLMPNGDVSLCCMDYGLDNIIGNLDRQSYEDVIPEAESCYDICTKCENAAHPAPKPMKFFPR